MRRMVVAVLVVFIFGAGVLSAQGGSNAEREKQAEEMKRNLEETRKALDAAKAKAAEARAEAEAAKAKALENMKVDREKFTLYAKKGRSWIHKTTVGDQVVWKKIEVESVEDDHAVTTVTAVDAEGKDIGKVKRQTVSFRVFVDSKAKDEAADDKDKPEVRVEETIKVEAGEFLCFKEERKVGKSTFTSWTHKSYPQLLVKQVNDSGVIELTQFNE